MALFGRKPTKKKVENIKIFVDGASKNNPGPSGAGVYITYKEEVVCKTGYFLGKKTNNQAEYMSLLIALFITKQKIKDLKIPILITSDSELMVKQIKGEYKVRNKELSKIKSLIDKLLEKRSYKIKHVLREKNKIADQLANEGIEKKKKLPLSFVKFYKSER